MVQVFSDALTTEKNKRATTAINLLRIDFGGEVGTRYYADHDLTGPDGNAYAGLVSQWPDVDRLALQSRGLEAPTVGDAEVTLVNVPVDGERVSDLFSEVLPEGCLCTILQWFAGLPSSDLVTVWAGYLAREKDSILFDDAEIHIVIGTLLDQFDRTLGELVSVDDFPEADPDALGRVQPEVIGSVDGLTALCIKGGGAGPLRNAVLWDEMLLELSDATAFTDFPMTVQIEDEQITVSGKTGNDLIVSARGVNGTTAWSHDYGMQCWELCDHYDYLVARRPVKAIRAVYVNGILQPDDGTVYQAFPSGSPGIGDGQQAFIRFIVLPVLKRAVNIVVTDEHSHATIIDQQPEVGASVTQQPDFATSQGSHVHDLTQPQSSIDQLGDGAWPTPMFGGGRTWTFQKIPTATSVVYTIGSIISSIPYPNGQITYAVGNKTFVYLYPNAPPETFTFAVDNDNYPYANVLCQNGATISLSTVKRTVQFPQAVQASAASGVATERVWDAAVGAYRLVDAASSTDRVGATVLGGNSTADVVVGGRVSVDLDGYPDNAVGTFTGTPGSLITRPDHVRRWVLYALGEVPLALIDAATFAAAGAQYASWGYSFNGALIAQISLRDLMQRFDLETRSLTTWDTGSVRLRTRILDESAASDKSIGPATMRPDTFGAGRPVQVTRTPLKDVFNQATALFDRDYSIDQVDVATGSGFRGSATLYRDGSIAEYGTRIRDSAFACYFTTSEDMAEDVLAYWLDQYQWIREQVEFEAYLTELELELGDIVTIAYPQLASLGNKGEVIDLDPRPGSGDRPDALRFKVLLFRRAMFRARLAEVTRILEALQLSEVMRYSGQEATRILESLDVKPTVSLAESSTISEALSLLAHWAPALTEASSVAENLVSRLQAILAEGTQISEATAQAFLNTFTRLGENGLGVDLLAESGGKYVAYLTDLVTAAEVLSFNWSTSTSGAEGTGVTENLTATLWAGALGLTGLAAKKLGGEPT